MPTVPAVALAAGIAASLDWLVREPPERLHPVAWFGRLVGTLDREWTRPTLVGLLAAVCLPLVAAALVGATVAGLAVAGRSLATAVGTVGPATTGVAAAPAATALAAAATAGWWLFATTSLRSLLETASTVVAAAETDLEAARAQLPALVGRDPAALDAAHVRSAVVESLAENLSDGLVAPLLAFSLLAPISLAAGAGAAAWVKAVNTMDSMLGYPDRPVGTAAARLDDVVMWLPARLTALLLTVAAASPDHVLAARRWAGAPASPNAGWPMGTAASALGVRLEKPGAYELGTFAGLPDADDARRGVRLVGRAGLLAYAIAALSGVIAWGS